MNPRIKRLLFILVPLTLALAVPAGISTWKGGGDAWNIAFVGSVIVLSWVVIVLGFFGSLDENKLRLGRLLGAGALLGLFVLAVGVVFFFSCAAGIPVTSLK